MFKLPPEHLVTLMNGELKYLRETVSELMKYVDAAKAKKNRFVCN